MSDKPEPKLCPYSPVGQYKKYNASASPEGYIEAHESLGKGFGPCLQEKCAMWRVLDQGCGDGFSTPHNPAICVGVNCPIHHPEIPFESGYCGLAGKP